jgi:hypothetical protein
MLARYVFTGITSLEVALHDTLLEFNGDLANTVLAVAANADITFKPCQLSLPAKRLWTKSTRPLRSIFQISFDCWVA